MSYLPHKFSKFFYLNNKISLSLKNKFTAKFVQIYVVYGKKCLFQTFFSQTSGYIAEVRDLPKCA